MFSFWNSKSKKIAETFNNIVEETVTVIDDSFESQTLEENNKIVMESKQNTEDLNLDKLC
jgi:vacuolar-type H+-ATPase subunit H